jgi:hypothetical protein
LIEFSGYDVNGYEVKKKPPPKERLLSSSAFMAVAVARRSASAMTGIGRLTCTGYTYAIGAGTLTFCKG